METKSYYVVKKIKKNYLLQSVTSSEVYSVLAILIKQDTTTNKTNAIISVGTMLVLNVPDNELTRNYIVDGGR